MNGLLRMSVKTAARERLRAASSLWSQKHWPYWQNQPWDSEYLKCTSDVHARTFQHLYGQMFSINRLKTLVRWSCSKNFSILDLMPKPFKRKILKTSVSESVTTLETLKVAIYQVQHPCSCPISWLVLKGQLRVPNEWPTKGASNAIASGTQSTSEEKT